MNKTIDARFERVEKALQTLITSISTYNPTPAHATDLLVADAELNQGLEQRKLSNTPLIHYLTPQTKQQHPVSTHQRNYEKILSLRSTSSTLDTQISETLTLLTNTRRALLNTPSTIFPPTTNQLSYTELLSYAKKISATTLPRNFRETNDTGPDASSSPIKDKFEPHTNGTTTPTVATNGSHGVTIDGSVITALSNSNNVTGMSTAMEIDSATPSNPNPDSAVALPQEWQIHLNPRAQEVFFPWPTEQDIKRGALATIQVLLERGEDLATFDPERGVELEAERKRIVEEEERVLGEERARVEEERRKSVGAGGAGGERREERPKVFQLETFDDDDSE